MQPRDLLGVRFWRTIGTIAPSRPCYVTSSRAGVESEIDVPVQVGEPEP